ncbi:MAG: Oar protein [Bryobacterales bacterium]|nr:Oar protein [Bryobacterales bacterium]
MALAIALAGTVSLPAQSPVGNIAGVVTDASGAAVAGATARAVNPAVGSTRDATTDAQGYFMISTLQPGTYKVKVEYKGFQTYTADVPVEVGQTSRLTIGLQVAGSATSVEVGSNAVQIDTERVTVGGVVNTKQIDELPLNGRNYLELAKLEPGVEISDGKAFDPTKTRYTGVSIGGRLGREARITLDGVDVVDEHVGTTTLNISQEIIQEFQVSTQNADASSGLGATGSVNIITKGGANDYHATGFGYFRNSAYAARPGLGPTAPDFSRRQYGGDGGGKLIKDKLFFFGGIENTHEASALSIASPFFPGLTSASAPYDQKSANARLDWAVNQNNHALFRWTRNEDSNFGGFGGNALPSTGNINADNTNQWATGLDTVFTARLTNSFRLGVTQFHNRILRPDAASQQLAVPGAEGFRIVVNDNSLTAGPDINTPQGTDEYFNQYRDDVTYIRGRHTVRIGGDVTYRQVSVFNFAACFPSITVNPPATRSLTDLLNSTVVSATIGNCNGKRIPGTPDNTHRNTRYSWYAEDTWRLRTNLTLNAGLRYEVDTHPLDNDLNKPAILAPILPNGTAPTPINKNNYAPHLGIAWDPRNDHKTSIRAGAGLYYAGRISNLVTNERASIVAFNSGNDTIGLAAGQNNNFQFSGGTGFDFSPVFTGTLKDALPVIAAGQAVYKAAPAATIPTVQQTLTGTIISNSLSTPYNFQASVGVQRELPWNMVIDTNLLYSRGVHEFMRDVDAANIFPGNGKPILLGGGVVPTKQITLITSDGFSRYRAFTVKLDKRFSKQFQYTVSYALSRVEATTNDGLGLSSGTSTAGGTLVNRNVKANFGPASLDRTHRLVANAIVNLPWGFRASLISTVFSGLPQSILVGSADLNGDGINGALLPGTHRGSLGRDVSSVQQLNNLIRQYNNTRAGKALPRGGLAPYVLELPDSTTFGKAFVSQDLQLSKVIKIKERLSTELTAQVFNLFNVSNLVGAAGLPTSAFSGVLTTVNSATSGLPSGFSLSSSGSLMNAGGSRALAGVDRATSFGNFSAVRPSIPTGTGLPRAAQFGIRLRF